MAVAYSTPQLVSAGSNTATGNVTGLAGGKRLLVVVGCRAASVAAPTTLTVGGVTATLANVGGTDATFDFTSGRYLSLYEISAAAASGLAGTQSCTITWTSADRVTMWVTELTGDDGSFVDIAIGATNGTSHTVSGLDSTATGQSLFSICERAGTAVYAWTTSSSDEIAEGGASGCSIGIGRLTLGAAGSYSSQWTATGGTGQIAVIGVIIAEASGGTTLNLTGATLGIAAAAGSVTPSVSKALTGAALGIAADAGTVSPVLTLGLTGAGLGIATAAGTVTVTIDGSITLALTGAGVTLTLAAGSVTLGASKALTGAAAGIAVAPGSVAPVLSKALTGATLGVAVAPGQVSPSLTVGLSGAALGLAAAAGTVTPSGSTPVVTGPLRISLVSLTPRPRPVVLSSVTARARPVVFSGLSL